jgi:dihydrofolate reductase
MKKVILYMVLSLDGFVCGPNDELDWEIQDPVVSRELIPELLSTVNTMLLGRVLYEGFQQAWPAMAKDPNSPADLVEFAHWVEDSKKFVFSKSQHTLDWKNSHLVTVTSDQDMINEVERLKKGNDGDMVVFGGAHFAQTLVRLGLVDEYRLKLQPILLGKGKPLFTDIADRRKLELVKAKGFDSGVVALYYRPIK